MSRIHGRALFVLGSLLVLGVGVGLVPLFCSLTETRPESGTYHGFLVALLHSPLEPPGPYWSATIQGQTSPQWRWDYPENFRYQTLEIEWEKFEGASGRFSLDLSSMQYTSGSSSGTLTEDLLRLWLTGVDASARDHPDPVISELFSFIRDAHEGALPPPRHHRHSIEGLLVGSVTHFALGPRVPVLATVIWVVIWLAGTVIVGVRCCRKRRARDTPTPAAASPR